VCLRGLENKEKREEKRERKKVSGKVPTPGVVGGKRQRSMRKPQ
jgi:hypothetical protein